MSTKQLKDAHRQLQPEITAKSNIDLLSQKLKQSQANSNSAQFEKLSEQMQNYPNKSIIQTLSGDLNSLSNQFITISNEQINLSNATLSNQIANESHNYKPSEMQAYRNNYQQMLPSKLYQNLKENDCNSYSQKADNVKGEQQQYFNQSETSQLNDQFRSHGYSRSYDKYKYILQRPNYLQNKHPYEQSKPSMNLQQSNQAHYAQSKLIEHSKKNNSQDKLSSTHLNNFDQYNTQHSPIRLIPCQNDQTSNDNQQQKVLTEIQQEREKKQNIKKNTYLTNSLTNYYQPNMISNQKKDNVRIEDSNKYLTISKGSENCSVQKYQNFQQYYNNPQMQALNQGTETKEDDTLLVAWLQQQFFVDKVEMKHKIQNLISESRRNDQFFNSLQQLMVFYRPQEYQQSTISRKNAWQFIKQLAHENMALKMQISNIYQPIELSQNDKNKYKCDPEITQPVVKNIQTLKLKYNQLRKSQQI